MNRAACEQEVRHWLEIMVVGEGLCPFAARPMREGRVRIAVCAEDDDDGIYRCVLQEVERLLNDSASRIETTVVALPRGLESFDHYLDMLGMLEDALEELSLDGVLQLASFHPDYVFDGVAADDVSNYTNRSPCPLFHLIREEELAAALESYPEPERIPERNRQRMHELGLQGIKRLLRSAAPGRR